MTSPRSRPAVWLALACLVAAAACAEPPAADPADGPASDGAGVGADVSLDAAGNDADDDGSDPGDSDDVLDAAGAADAADAEDIDPATDGADAADLSDGAAAPDVDDAGDPDAAGVDGAPDVGEVEDGQDADGGAEDAEVGADAIDVTDAAADPDDGAAAGASDAFAEEVADDASAADSADASLDAVDPPAPVTLEIDPATLPVAAFTDITAQFAAPAGTQYGPCIAVADLDADGDQDFVAVVFAGTKASVRAYLLGPTGTKLVTSAIDTTILMPSFGCSAADINGDNKPDLLFGGFSGAALYVGNGAGSFSDESDKYLPYYMDFAAFGVVPVDLDGDLDLDLFIPAGFDPPSCTALKCVFTESDLLCSVNPPMKKTVEMQDRVLIRTPNQPYVDKTAAWQVPSGGNQTVAAAIDIDEDGKMDVLVGDDMGTHRLLHNTGGAFATYETEIGFHPYAGAMGWGIGDLNDDAKFDMVLADSGPTAVYAQAQAQGGGPVHFQDMGGVMGVWWATWGASAWSPMIADFDHDGREDMLIGIGANFTKEQASSFGKLCTATQGAGAINPFVGVPSLDLLYLRDGTGWKGQKLVPGPGAHVVFLNQALIDLDDDGDLDVVQSRPAPSSSMMPVSTLRILRNDLPKAGGSFRVVVRGKSYNQDALGTVVSAEIDGVTRRRLLAGSGGFGGTAARFAHFGLGGATVAKKVQIRWPDGKVTALGDGKPGAVLMAVWP